MGWSVGESMHATSGLSITEVVSGGVGVVNRGTTVISKWLLLRQPEAISVVRQWHWQGHALLIFEPFTEFSHRVQ